MLWLCGCNPWPWWLAEDGGRVRCRASHARMSAWPRGKAATDSLACRQSSGGVGSACAMGDAIGGWANGAVGAAGWAASARPGRGLTPWACEVRGSNADVSSARPAARRSSNGGNTKTKGEAWARTAVSRQQTNNSVLPPKKPLVRVFQAAQTHFGRWRSGDGWLDGQCRRGTVKLRSSQGAQGPGRPVGRNERGRHIQHGRMADFAG